MGARSRQARRKIREAAEFNPARLRAGLVVPKGGGISLTCWTLAQIFAARDQQLFGHFQLPARMAESMRTDDALFVAYENRLAPQKSIRVKLDAAKGARGEAIAAEAQGSFGQDGVAISPETLADIHGCLVDHGVAFATNLATPREDGSRVDFELHYWPIEFVRWDSTYRVFRTRVDPLSVQPGDIITQDPAVGYGGAYELVITHGDGRWVVFQKHEVDPFKHGCLLAAAIVWARHAHAVRDWAKGSVAHGSAKVIGEMPAGVALETAEGALTPEAAAMADLLRAVVSDDAPAGIRPAGSKVDFLTNNSSAWQVWSELVANAEAAAARVYLGTDGTLGSKGGAPGVDVQALFGVASTIVEGDLRAIERGLLTGVIEPWCAMNFGDSSLAPKRCYLIPDPDADALKKSLGDRTAAFSAALKGRVDAGVALTQDDVNGLAADFGVRAPILASSPLPLVSDSAAPAPSY